MSTKPGTKPGRIWMPVSMILAMVVVLNANTMLPGQESTPQNPTPPNPTPNSAAANQVPENEKPTGAAQQDPATPSDVMTETLKTIREVENLNRYIEMNKTLQNENKTLKQQIASLTEQVNKLTQEIQTNNERLRQQLLTLPEFKIQSKVVGHDSARAILDVGGQSIRIREKVQMSIPVENGVWTLIQVEKITKDVVEIKFLELDRTITIYD